MDYLDRPRDGPDAIRRFLEEFPECIVIATCRRHQNHGKFNGSIEEQLGLLDKRGRGRRAAPWTSKSRRRRPPASG